MGTTSTPATKQRELLAPDLNIASLAGEKSATQSYMASKMGVTL